MSTERKSKRRRKRCRFCRKLFDPNPRVGSRQIACSDPCCQKARKSSNQAAWLERHPGYFQGRYRDTQRWLQEHPGYLAAYRRENPLRVVEDNERRQKRREMAAETAADIQDSISLQPVVTKALTPHLAEPASADIQDSISPQVVIAALFSARFVERRYTRLDRAPSSDDVAFETVAAALPP